MPVESTETSSGREIFVDNVTLGFVDPGGILGDRVVAFVGNVERPRFIDGIALRLVDSVDDLADRPRAGSALLINQHDASGVVGDVEQLHLSR